MMYFYLLSLSFLFPIILAVHSKRKIKKETPRPISSNEKILLVLFFIPAFISYCLTVLFWSTLLYKIMCAASMYGCDYTLAFDLVYMPLTLLVSLISATIFAAALTNYLIINEGWYETILPMILFVLFFIMPLIFYLGIYNNNLVLFLRNINLL